MWPFKRKRDEITELKTSHEKAKREALEALRDVASRDETKARELMEELRDRLLNDALKEAVDAKRS